MSSAEQSPAPFAMVYLRGHHFKDYLRARAIGADVHAANDTARFVAQRGSATRAAVNNELLHRPRTGMTSAELDQFDVAYAIDLVGETPEQAQQHQKDIVKAFTEIDNLGRDDWVILGLGKDAICGSCIFGSHCEPSLFDRRGDVAGIQTVDRLIRQIGRGDEATVEGAPDDESFQLVTSADVVRSLADALQVVNHDYPDMEFMRAANSPRYSPFDPPAPRPAIANLSFSDAIKNMTRPSY